MTEDERRALIAAALVYAGGTHSVDDVLEACYRGEFQMWEGRASVVVTQVVVNPQKKEAVAFLAAGSLEEIQEMYPVVEAWALDIGCTRLSCHGRPGWERTWLTKDAGWRPELVVYSKELPRG